MTVFPRTLITMAALGLLGALAAPASAERYKCAAPVGFTPGQCFKFSGTDGQLVFRETRSSRTNTNENGKVTQAPGRSATIKPGTEFDVPYHGEAACDEEKMESFDLMACTVTVEFVGERHTENRAREYVLSRLTSSRDIRPQIVFFEVQSNDPEWNGSGLSKNQKITSIMGTAPNAPAYLSGLTTIRAFNSNMGGSAIPRLIELAAVAMSSDTQVAVADADYGALKEKEGVSDLYLGMPEGWALRDPIAATHIAERLSTSYVRRALVLWGAGHFDRSPGEHRETLDEAVVRQAKVLGVPLEVILRKNPDAIPAHRTDLTDVWPLSERPPHQFEVEFERLENRPPGNSAESTTNDVLVFKVLGPSIPADKTIALPMLVMQLSVSCPVERVGGDITYVNGKRVILWAVELDSPRLYVRVDDRDLGTSVRVGDETLDRKQSAPQGERLAEILTRAKADRKFLTARRGDVECTKPFVVKVTAKSF